MSVVVPSSSGSGKEAPRSISVFSTGMLVRKLEREPSTNSGTENFFCCCNTGINKLNKKQKKPHSSFLTMESHNFIPLVAFTEKVHLTDYTPNITLSVRMDISRRAKTNDIQFVTEFFVESKGLEWRDEENKKGDNHGFSQVFLRSQEHFELMFNEYTKRYARAIMTLCCEELPDYFSVDEIRKRIALPLFQCLDKHHVLSLLGFSSLRMIYEDTKPPYQPSVYAYNTLGTGKPWNIPVWDPVSK
jgi:hypothetical protein